MDDLRKYLTDYLSEKLNKITISNSKEKGGVKKIHIRPILLREKVYFQFESFTEKQAFHENLIKEDAVEKIFKLMEEFKQLELDHSEVSLNCLISKKGKVTLKLKKKPNNNKEPAVSNCENCSDTKPQLTHNKEKKYLIPEGTPVEFLIDLGVMTTDGKIRDKMYDKYKQINRFLEFIRDIIPELPKDKELTIIDFGCGKSYLTFAIYYYLHVLNDFKLNMIGLDLKEDVIDKCNKLAVKYGFDKLKFLVGDIKDYEGVTSVDMVVTLHACDTATDYALYKAVNWGASVILSVPCCQHEMNTAMGKSKEKNDLSSLLSYGIIRERTCALFTDAIRAESLKAQGYAVQLLEFIDMEHTPKNILIRAVKARHKKIEIKNDNGPTVEEAMKFLGVKPLLPRLFDGE